MRPRVGPSRTCNPGLSDRRLPLPAAVPMLPLSPHPALWIVLVPLAPFLGALLLALAGHRLSPRAAKRLGVLAPLIALATAALAAFRLFSYGPEDRLLLARPGTLIDAGAVHIEATLALDPLSAAFALASLLACVLVQAAVGSDAAGAPRIRATMLFATSGALLAWLGDDLAVIAGGLEIGAICAWALATRQRTARRGALALRPFIVGRIAAAFVLLAGLLLFWSLGARGWSDAGTIQRDVSLARLVGATAAHDISATRRPSVPVGVEEAVARGDRLAAGATYLVPGPTLSLRAFRDMVVVESAGVRSRLEAMSFHGRPVLVLLALLLLIGALAASAQVPFQTWLSGLHGAPPPALAIFATMTAATGLHLLLRLPFLLAMAPEARVLLAAAGLATVLLSAVRAGRQYDLVRAHLHVALAQLGFTAIAISLGAYAAAALQFGLGALTVTALFLSGNLVARPKDPPDFLEGGRPRPASRLLRLTHALATGMGGGVVLSTMLGGALPVGEALDGDSWWVRLLLSGTWAGVGLVVFALARAQHLAYAKPAEPLPEPPGARLALFAAVVPLASGLVAALPIGRAILAALIDPSVSTSSSPVLAHPAVPLAILGSVLAGTLAARVLYGPRAPVSRQPLVMKPELVAPLYAIAATSVQVLANLCAAVDRVLFTGASGWLHARLVAFVNRRRRAAHGERR